jgi:hypothetical protein
VYFESIYSNLKTNGENMKNLIIFTILIAFLAFACNKDDKSTKTTDKTTTGKEQTLGG